VRRRQFTGIEVCPFQKLVVRGLLYVGFEANEDPLERTRFRESVLQMLRREVGSHVEPEGIQSRHSTDDIVHDVRISLPVSRRSSEGKARRVSNKASETNEELESGGELDRVKIELKEEEKTDQLLISKDFTLFPLSSPSSSRMRLQRGINLNKREGARGERGQLACRFGPPLPHSARSRSSTRPAVSEKGKSYSLPFLPYDYMLPEMVDRDWDMGEDGEKRKSCSLEVDRGDEVEDRIEDLSRSGEDIGGSGRSRSGI